MSVFLYGKHINQGCWNKALCYFYWMIYNQEDVPKDTQCLIIFVQKSLFFWSANSDVV